MYKVNFEKFFKLEREYRNVHSDTFRSPVARAELNSIENILMCHYMAQELDKSNFFSTLLQWELDKLDYKVEKKYKYDDCTHYEFKPKVKEFKDGMLGQSFKSCGFGFSGHYEKITVDEPENTEDLFFIEDGRQNVKRIWIINRTGKTNSQLKKLAHQKLLAIEAQKKKVFNNMSEFEKKISTYYEKCKMYEEKDKEIYKFVSSLEGYESNKKITFKYFPVIITFELWNNMAQAYNIDIKTAKDIYHTFWLDGFSNQQWNNAVKDYLQWLNHKNGYCYKKKEESFYN